MLSRSLSPRSVCIFSSRGAPRSAPPARDKTAALDQVRGAEHIAAEKYFAALALQKSLNCRPLENFHLGRFFRIIYFKQEKKYSSWPMRRKKRRYSGWALALTLSLALWGAKGNPGRWGIVTCCAGIALCILYELAPWALSAKHLGTKKIVRSVIVIAIAAGASGAYGWQFWPKWQPFLHITGYTYYVQTPGMPLRIGIHILNDSENETLRPVAADAIEFINGNELAKINVAAEAVFATAEKEFEQRKKDGTLVQLEVPPKASMHFDVDSSPYTATQSTINEIVQGTSTVIFAGIIEYTDGNDTTAVPFCGFTEGSIKNVPNCSKHNAPYVKRQP